VRRIKLTIETIDRLEALKKNDEAIDQTISRGLDLVEKAQGASKPARTKEEQIEYDYWDRDNWDEYMAELKYYREKYGDSYRILNKPKKTRLTKAERLFFE